jgi:hypothetical protein
MNERCRPWRPAAAEPSRRSDESNDRERCEHSRRERLPIAHSPFEPACHDEEIASVNSLGLELKRDPQIRTRIELLGVEIRAQDPDDDVWDTTERDGLTDDSRIAAESSRPEAVAHDGNGASVGPIFISRERATVQEPRPKERKELRRDARQRDLLGLGSAARIDELEPVRRHFRKHRGLAPPDLECLSARHRRTAVAGRRDKSNERCGVGRLERFQEHCVHDGKNRRVRADAQCQRENRNHSKSRLAAHVARGIGHVLPDTVEKRSRRCASSHRLSTGRCSNRRRLSNVDNPARPTLV